jgi:hypothetical protein
MSRIGLALAAPPDDPKLTPEQLRQSLAETEELKAMWDRLWHLHPTVAADLDQYLNDYVTHLEYGNG